MLMFLCLVRPDLRGLHNAGFCCQACQIRMLLIMHYGIYFIKHFVITSQLQQAPTTHIHTNTYTHAHTHTHTQTHTHTPVTYTHTHTHTVECVHTGIHTHTYVCTHTQTHTHTHLHEKPTANYPNIYYSRLSLNNDDSAKFCPDDAALDQ